MESEVPDGGKSAEKKGQTSSHILGGKQDDSLEGLTEEERAAIERFLKESGSTGAPAKREGRLAVASLKFAAMLLLAAGVGVGLGDGDEFDQAGCSVAQRPAGKSHRGSSGKAGGGGGGNVARTSAGSDGRSEERR